MNFSEIKYVHFLGIGGIGMSALARYFKWQGIHVSGYDKTKTQLTMDLVAEGMQVYYEEGIDKIPEVIKKNPKSSQVLIIYTPALPRDHSELKYFTELNVKMYKRAEILGEISQTLPCVAVGGTHGKTTTTSMLTFLCREAGKSFIAFVGGINENFNSNFITQGKADFMLTEADEYDRSFLLLHPQNTILTSMDADHLDIYGTESSVTDSFRAFAKLTNTSGLLLVNKRLDRNLPSLKFKTYGQDKGADYWPDSISFENGAFTFDFVGPGIRLEGLRLTLPGYHNLENACAAIAMALNLGVEGQSISSILPRYRGVKRRFEYHIRRKDLIYIDDYAHHPSEIDAVLSSIRKMYPDKKLTCVFQPHLFSRTRDFAEGFAESLAQADELILMEIYPAREEPMPGITSAWLLEKVKLKNKSLCGKKDLAVVLQKKKIEVLLTLGAGDIDQQVQEIINAFKE